MNMKIDKVKVKRNIIDILFLTVACFLGSFATVSVLLPNGLTSGGLTGLVRILEYFTKVEFSVIYYIISFIIMVLIAITLGFKEVKKSILLSIMYPAMLFFLTRIDLKLLEEKDTLLAAIFVGIFSGAASGIVIWRGYSFSGIDAISKIIRKKFLPQIPQGKIMIAIDVCIILVSAFIFDRNIALYAIITQAVIAKTIDVVIFGFEFKIVQIEIVTKDKDQELIDFIISDMGRGATSEKVVGEYTKTQYRKIRVYCSPRESIILKRKIAEIDNRAFVSVIKAEAVWARGKGFKNIKEDI